MERKCDQSLASAIWIPSKYNMTEHGIIIILILFLLHFGSPQSTPEEGRLLDKLLESTSSDIRPLPKQLKGPTVVNITIRIIQPLEIDERNEILSLLTWTNMYWEDSAFTWDPAAHNNIDNLLFPAEHIWIPDIILDNTHEISSGCHLGLPEKDEDMPFLASATANGTMSLAFPHIFKSICELKISEYPFDTQNCPLTFGSWAYNESEVVINIDVLRSVQYTVTSKAWKIMGTNCQKKPSRCVFDDDDESCNTAHCFIELRRSAWFEVISYTLPTIIIAALSLMVFMVPPEAGKRMEVGITLILCVAVYLSLINKKMPSTSESFPLVSKFYGCIIVEITIAMVCSCYCLHIYDPEGLRLLHFPNHLRTLAFSMLARLTFYKTKGGKPSRVHPTNAEVKIAEKRRRSVIALNSSIQNSDTAIQRVFNPKQNGQFRMQMEEIKECPETPDTPRKEVMEENSNNNGAENVEQSQERAVELPLEDVEGEAIEDEQIIPVDGNPNENQINGENRCDSGFGEPGGSMSNRSSLLSSNSVRLPVDASQTPPPQCGINCECGQPNCNGQGGVENSEPCQEESIESNAVPPDAYLGIGSKGDDGSNFAQFGKSMMDQTNGRESWPVKRAQTVLTRDSKTSSAGPLSQMLTARPYTDSVLTTWKRRKNIKKFQSSLRSNADLHFDDKNVEAAVGRNQQRKHSTTRASSNIADEPANGSGENTTGVSEQSSERSDSKMSEKSSKNGSQGSKRNSSNVQPKDLSTSNNETREGIITEIRTEPSLDGSKSGNSAETQTNNPRSSYDEIELVDINEEENLATTAEMPTSTAAATTPNTETIASKGGLDTRSGDGKQSVLEASTERENQQAENHNQDESGSGTESEVEHNHKEKKNDVVKRKISEDTIERPSAMVDPNVLFARRQWDTLRNRMQRRITVKEVFGQILSPKETSPIVAIANVLLRDQRKYVMRTEWMTSAIIINRFFIILLALAVFISLLAVFLQSSRLRNYFDS